MAAKKERRRWLHRRGDKILATDLPTAPQQGAIVHAAEINPAYPTELENAELELLRIRRGAEPGVPIADRIGFGLSGGGIRSATFCLGVFQALAQLNLLSKIDYISTVSGGGYFGAFYGRLFTRKEVKSIDDVTEVLVPRAASAPRQSAATGGLPLGKVFHWLRENGRYLAPNGSGDVLLAGAAMLRNFLAVHLVLATFVLMVFVAAQLLRGGFEIACRVGEPDHCGWWTPLQNLLAQHLPGGEETIWWSPFAALVPLVFLIFAVPPGWCYWLVEKPSKKTAGRWIAPIFGWLAAVVLTLPSSFLAGCSYFQWTSAACRLPEVAAANSDAMAALVSLLREPFTMILSAVVLAVSLETLIWGLFSGYVPRLSESKAPNEKLLFDDEKVRLRLSLQLKTALIATGGLLAFAVIDSLAQTFYGAALLNQFRPRVYLTAIFGPLLALAGFGRTIVSAFGGKSAGRRFNVPLKLAAAAAAIAVVAILLIAVDAVSYMLAWQNKMPLGLRPDWTEIRRVSEASKIEVRPLSAVDARPNPCAGETTRQSGTPAEGWKIAAETPQPNEVACGKRASIEDLSVALLALLIAFIFSFLFGWSWPFLNRSTHQAIYTSRLIRAYLGASNPDRLTPDSKGVTQAIAGDDIKQEEYWPRFQWLADTPASASAKTKLRERIAAEQAARLKKGMPLHLVNVTINETLDARSQVEQRDRKGIGMAIGPAGLSAGVIHHMVLCERAKAISTEVYPRADERDPATYRMFQAPFRGEFLTLGNWVGISGAAFSTSLGWQTSIGFSLLAGLANVRLTYWWNSGVKPRLMDSRKPLWRRWLSQIFESLFSVQAFFFSELLARFHGTARQWWPLSDGGHFENLGGYELIRRRLPMIVIIDAEADPDYTFEGLSNLVRKARLDFGAEIKFLSEEELDHKQFPPEIRKNFGTLEQLRRGVWVEEPIDDPIVPATLKRRRRSISPVNMEALSLAHAALAEVTYTDTGEKCRLVYLKPTLIGDESADVHRYHTEHASFPHESTLQQFFDEAQWESYRKLGEHIATKIFQNGLTPFTA